MSDNETKMHERKRLNPSLRTGTWERLSNYGKKFNLDSSTTSDLLEKIIHDHCDLHGVENPLENKNTN